MPRVQGFGTGPWKHHVGPATVQSYVPVSPLNIEPVDPGADTMAVDTNASAGSINLGAIAETPEGRTHTIVNTGTSGNNVGVNPVADLVGSGTLTDGEARTYQRIGAKWHEISNNV